jgi:electron transfer flavoprotein alpha/beta subunit
VEKEAEKSTHLNELNVRKPFVVSISPRIEEMRFYSVV